MVLGEIDRCRGNLGRRVAVAEMPGLLEKACRIVEPLGGSIEFTLEWGYPPTSNSPEATAVAVDALTELLGEKNVRVAEQGMGAEDFSFMAEVAPGCFIRLGVHDPAWGENVYHVHRADFRLDEDALI